MKRERSLRTERDIMSYRPTRRGFNAGMTAACLTAMKASSASAVPGANERVRLGIIGLGNRGDNLVDVFKTLEDAAIVALCDVYKPYLEFSAKKVGGRAFTTHDYRDILNRKDVDAVVIATPDHWHALQFVHACEAGKDIYVEKPLSLVVGEGRVMIEAARKSKSVVQVGIHRRSMPMCLKLAELAHEGAIGQITACRCFHLSNEFPFGLGKAPDTAPPPGLDWDLWLGPAPKVPYNDNRSFYNFRWYREYSGGQMTNFGTHWIDMIQWVIRQDAPRGVFAVGSGGHVDDRRNVPETMEAVWDYPDGTIVSFFQSNTNGAAGAPNAAWLEIRGTKGTLYLHNNKIELIPEPVRNEPMHPLDPIIRNAKIKHPNEISPAGPSLTINGQTETVSHARDFLDCIKSRGVCRCPLETGHRSTVSTLIANIAGDRKKYLAWDAAAERFTNDEEANKALTYEYREPWKL